MRNKTIIAAILALASLFAAEASCQIAFNQPGSFAMRFNYSGWTLDPASGPEESISQMTLGLSGFVPVRDNFEARYQIVSGYNDLDMDGTRTDMSGLGDLRLQLAHSFSRDRLLLSAGLNLPTGKKELDSGGERRIIEFLSRDYLSLPLRRYGEGFGFNLQAGGAAELGPFKCGMSGVYDYCGSYKPYEESGDYDPGDAFSLNATTAVTSGRIEYTGDFGFSFFGTDALDNKNIYRQAPQFSARLMAALPGERYGATLGMRMILRGRNRRYDPTDGVIDSQLKKYGDEFDVFLRVARSLGTDWKIGGLIGTRQILSGEEDLGKSSLLNFALDLGRDLSRNLGLDAGVMYYTGSADGGDVGIGGLQISGGLRVSY
ncbi:MAG: hypothetical protein NTW97_05030 [Candidatus Krumholzibacteria bacterium]|nr:hypothetical protein [Candidatus Krumholzibacteria bacterium]